MIDIDQVNGLAAALGAISPVLSRGMIYGMMTSPAVGFTTTRMSIADGQCRDQQNIRDIILVGGITKRLDAQWVVGNNNGGRDVATAFPALSWGHTFVIYNPTTFVVDGLLSQSALTPTLPTGFTSFRRVGSFLTDASANLWQFKQKPGGYFQQLPRSTNLAGITGQSQAGTLRQLHVPRGIKVKPTMYFQSTGTTGNSFLSGIYDPDDGPPPQFGVSTQWAQHRNPGEARYLTHIVDNVFCDTNGRVYTAGTDGSDTIALGVLGWWDYLNELGS